MCGSEPVSTRCSELPPDGSCPRVIAARTDNTPLRNNAELAEHLLRMAAHPGWHDNRTGYGPLLPFSYFSS